jgi:hypothetical protein
LREGTASNPIAANDAVHPDVVVKEISRHGAGNFVDVLESRQSTYFDYLCSSKSLPVETFRSQETGEFLAELVEELNGIRGNEYAFIQNNNRRRKDILVTNVAVWVPT